MTDLHKQLASNLDSIQARITAAALRSGRDPQEISLVAVCKYVTDGLTAALVQAGCLAVGESRPQQLWDKRQALATMPVQWHMIGHLQRNKVKRTIESLALLHSGDSLRLLSTVNDAAATASLRLPVLLQVNISGETSKSGVAPEDAHRLLAACHRHRSLEVVGLMAIPRPSPDPESSRPAFAQLRAHRMGCIV